jgi:hypothetical protein
MNGRAIPGAYLFCLYVYDKEMSWPHHIAETHQPDWIVYFRDRNLWEITFQLTNVVPERIIFISRGITVCVSIQLTSFKHGYKIITFSDALELLFMMKHLRQNKIYVNLRSKTWVKGKMVYTKIKMVVVL